MSCILFMVLKTFIFAICVSITQIQLLDLRPYCIIILYIADLPERYTFAFCSCVAKGKCTRSYIWPTLRRFSQSRNARARPRFRACLRSALCSNRAVFISRELYDIRYSLTLRSYTSNTSRAFCNL